MLITPETATLDDGTVIGSIGAYVQETTLAELLPPDMQRQVDYNVLTAILPAVVETWSKSLFVLDSVKKMFVGLISVKNVNGPITIAQVA